MSPKATVIKSYTITCQICGERKLGVSLTENDDWLFSCFICGSGIAFCEILARELGCGVGLLLSEPRRVLDLEDETEDGRNGEPFPSDAWFDGARDRLFGPDGGYARRWLKERGIRSVEGTMATLGLGWDGEHLILPLVEPGPPARIVNAKRRKPDRMGQKYQMRSWPGTGGGESTSRCSGSRITPDASRRSSAKASLMRSVESRRASPACPSRQEPPPGGSAGSPTWPACR